MAAHQTGSTGQQGQAMLCKATLVLQAGQGNLTGRTAMLARLCTATLVLQAGRGNLIGRTAMLARQSAATLQQDTATLGTAVTSDMSLLLQWNGDRRLSTTLPLPAAGLPPPPLAGLPPPPPAGLPHPLSHGQVLPVARLAVERWARGPEAHHMCPLTLVQGPLDSRRHVYQLCSSRRW